MPEETGTGERTVAQRAAEDHRIRLINRIVLIGVLVAIGSLIPYGQYYFQQGIWQALIDTGGLLVAIVGMGLAYRTAHRGKPETAGHVLLLTLIIT